MRPAFNERSHPLLRERRKQGIAFASPKHGVELSRSLFYDPFWVNALADYGRRAQRVPRVWTVPLKCPRFLCQGLWEYGLSNG